MPKTSFTIAAKNGISFASSYVAGLDSRPRRSFSATSAINLR